MILTENVLEMILVLRASGPVGIPGVLLVVVAGVKVNQPNVLVRIGRLIVAGDWCAMRIIGDRFAIWRNDRGGIV